MIDLTFKIVVTLVYSAAIVTSAGMIGVVWGLIK